MNEELQARDIENEPNVPDDSELRTLNVDWYLASLVNEANFLGIERDVTLFVSGVMITGTLISMGSYFHEFADPILSAKNVSDADKILAERYKSYANSRGPATQDDIYSERPHYIHLRNARTYFGPGNSIPSKGGDLWRGKISAVDGHVFGQMTTIVE